MKILIKSLFLTILLISAPAYAVINIYVDTDEGTDVESGLTWTDAYDCLFDAEAENLDLVTAEDSCVIHCRASSGTADSTYAAGGGWTTSATYTLTIQCDTADRHEGEWDATKYRLEMSREGACMTIRDSYTYVVGLQVHNTNDSSHIANCMDVDSGSPTNIYIDSCIIRGGQEGSAIRFYQSTIIAEVTNCIVYKDGTVGTTSEGIYGQAADTVDIYNTLVMGFNDGIEEDAATVTIVNSAVFNNATDFDSVTTITNCASDDGDGTAPQTLDDTSDYGNEFTDVTTGDFSLIVDGVCVDNGTNTGAPALDIIGTSRPQNSVYDIGAFEYISVGTPTNFQVIFFE